MITDLFSHKIHSSGDDWPDKLVELAFIFSDFDGKPFDRDAIDKRLMEISPRSSYVARDASKFRDEISAYPAYLGLYKLESSAAGWILRLSETAKKFLLQEQPDVGAFMRLQLTLFQFPNGMGMSFSKPNRIRVQANSRDRTLDFIRCGMHLSPVRLISRALIADSVLKRVSLFDATLTYKEIFALANSGHVNKSIAPEIKDVASALEKVRTGELRGPVTFERRFHILKHTGIFEIHKNGLSFRKPINKLDEADLLKNIDAVVQTKSQFNGFDRAKTGEDLVAVVARGDWAEYFDGVKRLAGSTIEHLISDSIQEPPIISIQASEQSVKSYPLRQRQENLPEPEPSSRKTDFADPEVTRIKRQRRNLAHKLLVSKMDRLLRDLSAEPKESPHIDICAKIPSDGSFLFEVKSGGENLLEQIRKGVSQLYEYRYRYENELEEDVILCLVLPSNPTEPTWLDDYLCNDRKICFCWFDDEGLKYPESCAKALKVLRNS